jgi:uncharacterized protein (DUF983 family)
LRRWWHILFLCPFTLLPSLISLRTIIKELDIALIQTMQGTEGR